MKHKILKIILAASLIVNIGLIIRSNQIAADNRQRDLLRIDQADGAICNASNISHQIIDQWSDLTEVEIVNRLNQVDREIYSAMLLLIESDSYFAPLKGFRQKGPIHEIIRGNRNDDFFIAYQNEYHDLQFLCAFLAKNRIADLGIEEVRSRWNELDHPLEGFNLSE